jgi:hypothetical protein
MWESGRKSIRHACPEFVTKVDRRSSLRDEVVPDSEPAAGRPRDTSQLSFRPGAIAELAGNPKRNEDAT